MEMLSARELLERVYYELTGNGRAIKLPSKAMAEIADDSDYHRTKKGYTGYDMAKLVNISGKEWAIAFGVKCGAYPCEPFNCDIAAVSLSSRGKSDSQLGQEVYEDLQENYYFRSSLIFALADGQLGTQQGAFAKVVAESLVPNFKKFVAKGLEIDPEIIHMDLRPVVTSEIQYKPEFVDFLKMTLHEALVRASGKVEQNQRST